MDEKSKTTFDTPCTPPQDGEEGAKEEVRKYNSERTYDIGDIRKTMKMILPKEYLERTDLSNAEKRVLAVILHTCRSDAYKKLGGYYPISNANLKANAKIGSTGLTPITNHLKELGLIDFEQGEGRTKGKQRKATRYTILFDDKLIQKERFITDSIKPSEDSIKPSEDSIKPSEDSIKPSEDSIKPSYNPTIKPRTSTSVDNQEVTPIDDGKSGAVYVKGNLNGEVEGNLKLKRNLEGYLKVEGNVKGNLEGNVDVNVDGNGEVNLDGNVEGNLEVKGGVSTNNNNIGNTNNKMEELIKKLITSIDNNTRVQSEHNTKLDKLFELIEENNKSLNELQVKLQSSSMDNNGKSNGVVQSTIDTNDKVDNTPIESSSVKSEYNSNDINKSSSKSSGEVKYSSSSNFDDRIMSYQLGLASSNPIKDRAWKREQQKKVDTKTASKTTVQESNSKEDERNYVLQKLDNLKKSWIEKINTATTEEKLFEYSDESLQQFSDFAKTHIEIQKESKEVFKELQPLFEAKYNQFQTHKETTPKAETCEEKKETTAEPSTANSKSIEVSNVDTSDSKEEQKKLDDELDEKASTKKSEEVEIPKAEEQKQLQELKETLKPLLENFNEVGTSEEHERILNEIRKAYTTKGYSQKVLQPFLDFAITYNFYAEKRDVVEVPHQETPSEVSNQTVEEPKQDETVTPSEEPIYEDYLNPTFTDEQAQETLSRLPNANSRYEEEEYQEEVIDDDMPSDKEVASVVGGYDEENDEIF